MIDLFILSVEFLYSTGNTLRQRQRGHWGGRPSHRTAYFRNEVETRNKLSENHLQPLVDLCISIDWTSREVGHNVELCLLILIFIWWSWIVFTFPLTILKMPPRPRVSDGQASARISRMHVTWDQDKCGKEWEGRDYQTRFFGPVRPLQRIFRTGPGSPDEMNKFPRTEFLAKYLEWCRFIVSPRFLLWQLDRRERIVLVVSSCDARLLEDA